MRDQKPERDWSEVLEPEKSRVSNTERFRQTVYKDGVINSTTSGTNVRGSVGKTNPILVQSTTFITYREK